MSDLEHLSSMVTVEFPGDPRTRTGYDEKAGGRLSSVVKEHNRKFEEWWKEFSAVIDSDEMALIARYAMSRLMLAETAGPEVRELQEQLQRSYDKGVLVEKAAGKIFKAAGMDPYADEVNRHLSSVIREILSSVDENRLRALAGDADRSEE